MSVDTTQSPPPKLLPAPTTTITCPHCKLETGFTKEDILATFISGDICCPNEDCKKVIYSSKPERPIYNYGTSAYGGRGGYDYDY